MQLFSINQHSLPVDLNKNPLNTNSFIFGVICVLMLIIILTIIFKNKSKRNYQNRENRIVSTKLLHQASESVKDLEDSFYSELGKNEDDKSHNILKMNSEVIDDDYKLQESRTASQADIITDLDETKAKEMLEDKNTKLMLHDRSISYKTQFSNVTKAQYKYLPDASNRVIEEDSSSLSPNTSLKRIKSNHVKDQVKYVSKEYQSVDGEIFEIKDERTITKYNDNPELRKIVSYDIEINGKMNQGKENENKYYSSKNQVKALALMPVEPKDTEISSRHDFTDDSFNIMNKKNKFTNRYENKYSKTGRSKTFLEDDVSYFQASDVGQQNKNSRNHPILKANSKPSVYDKDNISVKDNISIKNMPKFQRQVNNEPASKVQALVPRQMVFTRTPQILGRITKSKRTDYQSKIVEKTKSVQTQEDIIREDSFKHNLSNFSLTNQENSLELVRFDSMQICEEQRNSKSNSETDYCNETGKVKELGNCDSSQGRSVPFYDNKEYSHNDMQLERISSNEVEEDKDDSILFEKREQEAIDFEDESEDQVIELHESNILKYVDKTSPLYIHLKTSHTNSFKIISPIGKGGFGSVVKAKHILDNNTYAIKNIKLHLGVDQDIKNHKVFREVQTMTIVNNANVVRYYTCWLELADDSEQLREQKKILKRYSHYSKASKNIKKPAQKSIKAKKSDNSYEISNQTDKIGISKSKNDKSDTSIEWEQGDDNSNNLDCSEQNDSESLNFDSKNNSMFDEESKIPHSQNKVEKSESEESEESDEYSSDSLDSVFDYTT